MKNELILLKKPNKGISSLFGFPKKFRLQKFLNIEEEGAQLHNDQGRRKV